MWRKLGESEEVTEVAPGVSITLPTDTHFQFRCDGGEPLEAVAAPRKPLPSREFGSRRSERRDTRFSASPNRWGRPTIRQRGGE
jgi:hypothetical protein